MSDRYFSDDDFYPDDRRYSSSGPVRTKPVLSVWSPKLTREEKEELEAYIREHNLPF